MNRWIIAMVCVLVLSLMGTAMAAEKYGFVDMREIMTNSDAGKKTNEEFKKIYEKNRIIVQGRESELQKMKDELEKQRTILTESALKEKEAAIQVKFREYQNMVKEANDEVQAKNQEIDKGMIPEIQKIATSIGEKEKYSAIFDIGSMPVLFYGKANANDLTKRVMDEYNKTYKQKK